MKLDRTVASRLPLPADRYKPDVIYFDRVLPDFGLRIRARKRTFIVQYHCCAGKTRRLLLGAETDKFNVTEARKAADTVLAKVKLGHDPQGEKAAARTKDKDQKTFGAIVDMYLEDKRGGRSGAALPGDRTLCGETKHHPLPRRRREARHETLNPAHQPASAKRDPERASSIRKGEAAGSEHFSSFGAADQRP